MHNIKLLLFFVLLSGLGVRTYKTHNNNNHYNYYNNNNNNNNNHNNNKEYDNATNPFGQLIMAYYSGVGIDSVGSGGLNSLSLAFFSPGAMTGNNCDFTDPLTPCLRPAAGAGPSLSLQWVLQTFNTSVPMLRQNCKSGIPPVIFIAFGGQSEGGAAWDQIFGNPQTAAVFAKNCAELVISVKRAVGSSANVGIDLDIEGTQTSLPFFSDFIKAFRSSAPANSFPLQMDSLSGLASNGNPDHFKVAILQNFGPNSGGVTFVNLMVDNVQASCNTMSQFWRDPNLDFIPPSNKVFGFWGENLAAWILQNPGCTDGSSPLFPWMKSQGVGMGIWQWWSGSTNDITPVINQIRQ